MGLILVNHGRDVTPRRLRGQLRTAEKVVVGSRSRRKSGGSRFTAVRSFCSTYLPDEMAWNCWREMLTLERSTEAMAGLSGELTVNS